MSTLLKTYTWPDLHFIPKNMVNTIVSWLLDVFTCLCYNSSTPQKVFKDLQTRLYHISAV